MRGAPEFRERVPDPPCPGANTADDLFSGLPRERYRSGHERWVSMAAYADLLGQNVRVREALTAAHGAFPDSVADILPDRERDA